MSWRPFKPRHSFTLVELLVVVAIMAVLLTLASLSIRARRSADIGKASYDIAGYIAAARAYALAHNTYTWVGFYEEPIENPPPTPTVPPYPGRGYVVLGAVASLDGTGIYASGSPAASLPTNGIAPIAKLLRIEHLHLADLGLPTAAADADLLAGRPATPYTTPAPPDDHYSRISSESADQTSYPFSQQKYTFYKTIRFNPRGEANVNSTYNLSPTIEIGLKPIQGTVVSDAASDFCAIQLSGIVGNIKIYRP